MELIWTPPSMDLKKKKQLGLAEIANQLKAVGRPVVPLVDAPASN